MNPRFSRFSLRVGTDPDPRFTLANERTFLAWIRTSLALMAGGIAIEAFASNSLTPSLRSFMALALLLLAMVVSTWACFRWLAIERALRLKEPLTLPLHIPLTAAGVVVITLVFAGWLY
ncbi:YidH family protein [Pseudomonas sp. M30-35]|uniref:YidH family protein n=1 Tax=Pseudomonas sp. M30-35 TaxID=1981174 RepID=UPI000B3C1B5A|nr:DUF202 domain-containing protein [Pseudomonas sp. M30-35]ARU90531.1 hypothetical protein B9K09_22380 [Pseudomonas sp. M30-35]